MDLDVGSVVVSIPVRFTVGQQQGNAFYVPGHGVVTGKKARVVGQKKKEEGRKKKRTPECWKEDTLVGACQSTNKSICHGNEQMNK